MNSNDPAIWPMTNGGRWPRVRQQPDPLADCPVCAVKRPMTKAEVEQAVARAMGLFEGYECPNGLGWHLRVVKASDGD